MTTLNIRKIKQYDDAPANLIYKNVFSEDFVSYLESKGFDNVVVKTVYDNTNSSPIKTMIVGEFLNLAFYASGSSRIHGIDATIACEVVFKNGEVAMPYNSVSFNLTNETEESTSLLIDTFIKFNKSKLSSDYIHFGHSEEMLERMQNNGKLQSKQIEHTENIVFEEEEF